MKRKIISTILSLLVALMPIALFGVGAPRQVLAQTSDKLTRQVFASAARGTTTSSTFNIDGYTGFIAFLDVTAKSGTNPTLDLKFQDSINGSAPWFDIAGTTATQVTGTTSSQILVATRAPNSYVRAVATVGGSSTPLYTFSLSFLAYKGTAVAVTSTQGGTASFSGFSFTGANGTVATITTTCEEVTLSTGGATTDTTANLLPANSLILNVTAIVTTTITTATDWKLGDASVAGRFTAANSTLTAGTRDTGSVMWLANTTSAGAGPYQVAAAKLRITTTGTPDAGAIRVCVTALTFTSPTS